MAPRKKTTSKTSVKSASSARGKNSTRHKSTNSQAKSILPFRLTWLKTFLILCIFALSGAIWQSLFRPLSVTATGKVLQIKSGQTYSGLIGYLAQRDMIHYPIILKIYRNMFIHHTLKAGAYEIPAGISASKLLRLLNDGKLKQLNRVLLVEGMTFNQFKQRLAANPDIKKTVLNLPDAQILAAAGIPKTHPEGWFAPDTYMFSAGVSDILVLKKVYDKQKQIVDQEWKGRAADLPYHSINDALIMASIVEKETGSDGERAKVAAVFINRLKQGMRLQTDPTVIYGMGTQYNGNITRKDLETPTAYNTYKIDGLPPTPIAMPGRAAIHAALHPANIDALYFVATGTGGHKFSSTLAEHNAAVQSYLKVMRSKRNGS
ncbi:MAG: endolytic transglycosylase MltG [Candidatus Saccharibacteria bacterium]|nr:endolytic transglycosylase MltG [Moraxellaceae bacterium]